MAIFSQFLTKFIGEIGRRWSLDHLNLNMGVTPFMPRWLYIFIARTELNLDS